MITYSHYSKGSIRYHFYLRTFESVAREHIIYADKISFGAKFLLFIGNCLLRSDKEF